MKPLPAPDLQERPGFARHVIQIRDRLTQPAPWASSQTCIAFGVVILVLVVLAGVL